MNAKAITRALLLAVIVAAVAAWAIKEFGPTKASPDADGGTAAANVTSPAARPDGVTVINFHGERRCPTCVGIGTLAQKTIDEEFRTELRFGKIHWEHINYEEPANTHFVKEYELVSSTVLITLWKDGKEVKWNRLDGVWDHYGDDAKFRAYVAENVRTLLNQP